jgi:hypothetical protein
MTFGYLIIVSNSNTANYHRLAHALALSIKKTQPVGYDNVAIVTDSDQWLPVLNHIWAFDKVIFWNKEQHWDGRSHMRDLTPWDNTVCLDADMLFLSDYSHWIDKLQSSTPLYVTNKVVTFKGEPVTSDYYRRLQTLNNLPNFYSAFTWFKKDDPLSEEFFELVKYITKYPTQFRNVFIERDNGAVLGTDEIFALAAEILGITDQISYDLPFPRFVHMKSRIQNCHSLQDNWNDRLSWYFNRNAELKIGNYEQTDIVHYVHKGLITIDEINTYDRITRQRIKDEF